LNYSPPKKALHAVSQQTPEVQLTCVFQVEKTTLEQKWRRGSTKPQHGKRDDEEELERRAAVANPEWKQD
jgi:hypothetical protein